jgi:hypothetical protein
MASIPMAVSAVIAAGPAPGASAVLVVPVVSVLVVRARTVCRVLLVR